MLTNIVFAVAKTEMISNFSSFQEKDFCIFEWLFVGSEVFGQPCIHLSYVLISALFFLHQMST